MPETENALRAFAHLTPGVQAALRGMLHAQTFPAGGQIFMQGAPSAAFYMIASGRVKIVRTTPEGYESILCVRAAGEFFCPVTLLDGGTELGTAVAMTDTQVLWAERGAFIALCQAEPALLTIVQAACLYEVRSLINRLEIFAFRSVRERLARTLLAESRRQAGEETAQTVRMTQQELGALVGASRESVSRALARLEREGLVELKRGRVIIRNRARLRELAGQQDNDSSSGERSITS